MTKSSTIVFILFFAILFGLEKKVNVVCVFVNNCKINKKYFYVIFFSLYFQTSHTELVPDVNRCIDCLRSMYVYI